VNQYVHHQLLQAMRTAADHSDPAVREAALERMERWRQVTGPDGREGRRADAVVCLRRPESPAS